VTQSRGRHGVLARRALAFLAFALLSNVAGAVSMVERLETWWERFWSRPPFPILDSGYFAEGVGVPRLHWLDNDRVIFSGDPLEDGRKERRAGRWPKGRIHIWNVRTGEVSYYGEGISPPCYFDGFVYYLTRTDPDVYAYKEGPFGKEVEVRKPGYETPRKDGEPIPFRSVIDCRLYSPRDFPGPEPRNHWTRPLRPGHGHLVIDGIGGPPRPVILLRPSNASPVVLPLNGDEIHGDRIQYAPWADAYLLYSRQQRRNPAGTKPKYLAPRVMLMSPSGTITELPLPDRDWFAASTGFVYTRVGLILWSHAGRAGGIGHAGLYLVGDDVLRQLTKGFLWAIGVSPDGCTLAAALKKDLADVAPLRAIDLCATRR
jgi:hypothetical protein